MDIIPPGVRPDPRPQEEKDRDYAHPVGAVPIVWKELNLNNLGITVSQRYQDGSLSCLFQAACTAYEKISGIIVSASVYFWRKNYPEGGSYLQNVGDVFYERYTTKEVLSPSQNQSEAQMNQLKQLTTMLGITGYRQPGVRDIDQIAEAIETYGQCIVSYDTTSAEYGKTPHYTGAPIYDAHGNYLYGAFGHGICALIYGTINGVKTIVCRDSAGQGTAPDGIRLITEDFHKHRNTGALYFLGSKNISVPQDTQKSTEPSAAWKLSMVKYFYKLFGGKGNPYATQ